MACEILIKAFYTDGSYGRGYPIVIKDVPCVWGLKEGLPNFVIIRITNASKSQVNNYISKQWDKVFDYEILQHNAIGYRIKIQVDPAVVSVTGKNSVVTDETRGRIKDLIVNNFHGVLVDYTGTSATFDIPKINGLFDLAGAKAIINDIASEVVDTRLYYFSGTDVQWVVDQGGFVELTKLQVKNKIINKLDE